MAPVERAPRPIEAGVDIGHVHLRASDLGKIKDFYVGILGFDVVAEGPTMLFVSAGGYHHHLGFNTRKSKGANPPPPATTRLSHVAIPYPTRSGLRDALRRLPDAGYPSHGFHHHATHHARH